MLGSSVSPRSGESVWASQEGAVTWGKAYTLNTCSDQLFLEPSLPPPAFAQPALNRPWDARARELGEGGSL